MHAHKICLHQFIPLLAQQLHYYQHIYVQIIICFMQVDHSLLCIGYTSLDGGGVWATE